jgi:phosphate transport system substrate-binding protein
MFRVWRLSFVAAAALLVWDTNPGRSQTSVTPDAQSTQASPAAPLSAKSESATAMSSETSKPLSSNDTRANDTGTKAMSFQLYQMLEQLPLYRPAEKLSGKVVFSGSTTMNELGHQWARTFKKFHPEVEFSGSAEGSEVALKMLSNDPTIIAGVSRPVDGEDQKMLVGGKCKEPIAITVGMEAMALFVHRSNPIESISPDTIKAIFAARADETLPAKVWGDIGVQGELANQPIVIYDRGPNSGSQVFISKVLLAGQKIEPTLKNCETNSAICLAIATNPAGVGFADIHYEHPDVRRVPLIVQGQVVQANDLSVLAGKYPIVRPLMLVLDKAQLSNDSKLRESILRFVLSRDGQAHVMRYGFFPLDPGFVHQELNELFGEQLR